MCFSPEDPFKCRLLAWLSLMYVPVLASGSLASVRRCHGLILTVCQAYPDHHGEVSDEEKRRDGSDYLEAAVLPARDLTVLTDG